jgi:citrate lyase beta subunit
MTRLRRSLLFMPGDSRRKIQKATQLGADCIVMDLEDGVALSQKEAARQTIVEALGADDFGRSERLIRLSAPSTEFFRADLAATLAAGPDSYVVPKTEQAAQIEQLSRYLDEQEQARGWPAHRIRLLPIIETALGVMNVAQIAQASPRLEALLFGAEDLAGDMGSMRTRAGWEVFYARSAVVTAAAAYGLQAIDIVFFDLNDLEGFEAECVFGRQLGYQGKMLIHPRQVEIANRAFAPSPAEIERARRIVQAHREQQAKGVGAFELDGRMVDMPVVRAAELTLEKAGLAGLND